MSDEIDEKPAPKTAMAGTQMMRKSDVYSSVKKLLVLSGQSVDWAIEEGRQETEEFHRIRRRALYTIRDEFLDNCPIFINPETVKERGHD